MNSIALSPLCYHQLHNHGFTTCDKRIAPDTTLAPGDRLIAYAYAPKSRMLQPRLFLVSVAYFAWYDPSNPDNHMAKITLQVLTEILPLQI